MAFCPSPHWGQADSPALKTKTLTVAKVKPADLQEKEWEKLENSGRLESGKLVFNDMLAEYQKRLDADKPRTNSCRLAVHPTHSEDAATRRSVLVALTDMRYSTSTWQTGIPYLAVTDDVFPDGSRFMSGNNRIGNTGMYNVSQDYVFHLEVENPSARAAVSAEQGFCGAD